ncbi:MipA/OmpV family protein [Lysobacter sp. A6]|uniref:MipA/OmpV family protein n=1 Tax=Noviluteimonas lactosilytica TaxID=2888523 RepID=A0ABS8JH77_9GAMM|nr:MipA/OmpV family protein [Lysobacter lactosilyticus]MCC8362961.1 MipA/OmpV family protein [Lysobacter lactosilyticus]
MGSPISRQSQLHGRTRSRWRHWAIAAALGPGLCSLAVEADAQEALLGTVLEEPGSAALGFVFRSESSAYRDGGRRDDFLPLYLYEGERFFLRANEAGVRVWHDDTMGVEAFVERRLEGYPEDTAPPSLEGMEVRNTGADLGARFYLQQGASRWDLSVRHDVADISHGTEVRLGYGYTIQGDRWRLEPVAIVSWRSADLNDYYYGVETFEERPDRAAYDAGAGWNTTLALYGRYRILQNWSLIGGVYATHLSSEIRDSPIANDDVRWGVMAGATYDFGNGQVRWDDDDAPTWVKVFYGRDSGEGCHLVRIMTLQCVSLNDVDPTDVAGVHVGRPFVSRLNGWPLDLVGYAGVLRHLEKGRQPNGWQLDAYMKAFYYGFPWSHRVNTRLGFGIGVSYAERVPYTEVTAQARRGENTSKLLNYLEPSVDVSIGDLFGNKRWHDVYFGFAVSHRSGIFASSQLLGTVDGGSNYIYAYIEAAF